jgi:hypothetical protein
MLRRAESICLRLAKRRFVLLKRIATNTKTKLLTIKQNQTNSKNFRPLAEKREGILALSREEEKAV